MKGINITGSNNQINIASGKNNNQSNHLKVFKGSFETLSTYFQQNKVSLIELAELEHVLKQDTPDVSNRTFGNGVKQWIQKMLTKAVETTWAVGIEAAGGILAEGLNKYYGWS